jgi:hypothetical protein
MVGSASSPNCSLLVRHRLFMSRQNLRYFVELGSSDSFQSLVRTVGWHSAVFEIPSHSGQSSLGQHLYVLTTCGMCSQLVLDDIELHCASSKRRSPDQGKFRTLSSSRELLC